MPDLSWSAPGAVAAEWFADESYVKGLRGPVGSGKSVACCVYLLLKAASQAPGPDGIRRTRWAIVRNTNPQLKTTTVKTWLEWVPEAHYGKFLWSVPYTHHVKVGDIDAEFIFLSLDRPEDVRKLLSLDLTGVWVNEAREVHKEIIDGCTMRAGRYPPMRDGGPSWYGVIMDTNAPDDDHWWPIMAGDVPPPEFLSEDERLMLVRPDNWSFYNQPAGMNEVRNELGNLTGYEINPEAENLPNLPATYYPNIIRGKRKSWIDVYVRNQIGAHFSGKAVYERAFNRQTHVATQPLTPENGTPIRIGMDFGLTPAAIITQRLTSGRWLIHRELCARNMGAARFARILRFFLTNWLAAYNLAPRDFDIRIWGDPRGDDRAQSDETTPFQMLRTHGGLDCYPAPTNDPIIRIEAVEALLERMVEGRPAVQIDPSCVTLIRGFEQGYHYEQVSRGGESDAYDDTPAKNRYSHPHDALQYVMLGEGEGRRTLSGDSSNVQPIHGRKRETHVFDQLRRRRKRNFGL